MNCDNCQGTGIVYEVFGDGEVVEEGCRCCEEDEEAARGRMTPEEVAADLLFKEKN